MRPTVAANRWGCGMCLCPCNNEPMITKNIFQSVCYCNSALPLVPESKSQAVLRLEYYRQMQSLAITTTCTVPQLQGTCNYGAWHSNDYPAPICYDSGGPDFVSSNCMKEARPETIYRSPASPVDLRRNASDGGIKALVKPSEPIGMSLQVVDSTAACDVRQSVAAPSQAGAPQFGMANNRRLHQTLTASTHHTNDLISAKADTTAGQAERRPVENDLSETKGEGEEKHTRSLMLRDTEQKITEVLTAIKLRMSEDGKNCGKREKGFLRSQLRLVEDLQQNMSNRKENPSPLRTPTAEAAEAQLVLRVLDFVERCLRDKFNGMERSCSSHDTAVPVRLRSKSSKRLQSSRGITTTGLDDQKYNHINYGRSDLETQTARCFRSKPAIVERSTRSEEIRKISPPISRSLHHTSPSNRTKDKRWNCCVQKSDPLSHEHTVGHGVLTAMTATPLSAKSAKENVGVDANCSNRDPPAVEDESQGIKGTIEPLTSNRISNAANQLNCRAAAAVDDSGKYSGLRKEPIQNGPMDSEQVKQSVQDSTTARLGKSSRELLQSRSFPIPLHGNHAFYIGPRRIICC